MEALPITLDDYILTGGGFNGDSFDHRTDPSVMLKLYLPGKISQPLSELLMARKVYNLGIPTPEPGEYVVTEDGRYGIRFRRIVGKKSFARAIGDEPWRAAEYAERFAAMCHQLHATHVDTTQIPSVKEKYMSLLQENPFFTPSEKDKLARFILDAPETDTAIHGDLQFGNAIFTDSAQYFIDLGDFCYGHPLFDLGMVYLTCVLSSEEFNKEVFHMDNPTALAFWKAFAPAYFGKDRPLKDIEEEIRPYAGLKTLIIERDSRRPHPEFRAALSSIL